MPVRIINKNSKISQDMVMRQVHESDNVLNSEKDTSISYLDTNMPMRMKTSIDYLPPNKHDELRTVVRMSRDRL